MEFKISGHAFILSRETYLKTGDAGLRSTFAFMLTGRIYLLSSWIVQGFLLMLSGKIVKTGAHTNGCIYI